MFIQEPLYLTEEQAIKTMETLKELDKADVGIDKWDYHIKSFEVQ